MLANMIDPKGNVKKVFDIPTGTMLGKNKVTRKETWIYIYIYMYSPTSNGKIYMKINFMSWYQIRIQKKHQLKTQFPKERWESAIASNGNLQQSGPRSCEGKVLEPHLGGCVASWEGGSHQKGIYHVRLLRFFFQYLEIKVYKWHKFQ